MKLEKREITLNESDSLSDALETEKSLLRAYAERFAAAERRETAETLVRHAKEVAEDAAFVANLRKTIFTL